jgi:DNA-binding transcriptional LysR family regulator
MRRLRVSQPAVSEAIRQLERDLRVILLVRDRPVAAAPRYSQRSRAAMREIALSARSRAGSSSSRRHSAWIVSAGVTFDTPRRRIPLELLLGATPPWPAFYEKAWLHRGSESHHDDQPG